MSFSQSQKDELFSQASDGQEFNSYTLLGQWEILMISLIRQSMFLEDNKKHFEEAEIAEELRYHLMRGAKWLNARVKDLTDIPILTQSNNVKI